jgi:hypothetical protein
MAANVPSIKACIEKGDKAFAKSDFSIARDWYIEGMHEFSMMHSVKEGLTWAVNSY